MRSFSPWRRDKVYTSYTLLLFLHLSPQETSCKKCHAVTLWSHSHNRIFCDAKRRRLIFFFSFWLKTHNFSFCSNLREKLNLTWFQIPLSFYLYILFPLEFSTVDSPLLLFTLSSFFFVSVSSTNTFHFWWICSRVFEDYLSLLCVHPNHHPGRETLVRNSVSRQGMKWKHEKEGTESTFNSWLRERREREKREKQHEQSLIQSVIPFPVTSLSPFLWLALLLVIKQRRRWGQTAQKWWGNRNRQRVMVKHANLLLPLKSNTDRPKERLLLLWLRL